MRFLAKSLMGKLVLLFLLIALIPVAIVGYLSYRSAKSALQEATLRELSTSRDRARERITASVQQAFGDIEYLGATPAAHRAFMYVSVYTDFVLKSDQAKANPESPIDLSADEYKQRIADIDPTFSRFLDKFHKAAIL